MTSGWPTGWRRSTPIRGSGGELDGPQLEVIETQLTEVEIALLMAVNLALDAALLAGLRPQLTLRHMQVHEENFRQQGKRRAAEVMAALRVLHANAAAGLR
jgi:hypothetical protein